MDRCLEDRCLEALVATVVASQQRPQAILRASTTASEATKGSPTSLPLLWLAWAITLDRSTLCTLGSIGTRVLSCALNVWATLARGLLEKGEAVFVVEIPFGTRS